MAPLVSPRRQRYRSPASADYWFPPALIQVNPLERTYFFAERFLVNHARRILKQLELLFFAPVHAPGSARPEGAARAGAAALTPARAPATKVRRRVPSPVNDPLLHQTWVQLRTTYFPNRQDLDSYQVVWSSRPQKRVLASCNIRRRKVVVARELYEPSAVRWLSAVLYHELCHAVIGEDVSSTRGRRLWHGRQFRELEERHPDIAAMNVWLSSGGWAMAVRSHRSREVWRKRRSRV